MTVASVPAHCPAAERRPVVAITARAARALLAGVCLVAVAMAQNAAPGSAAANADAWSPAAVMARASQQFASATDDVTRLEAVDRIQELSGLYPPAAMLATYAQLQADDRNASPLLQAEIAANVADEDLRAGRKAEAAAVWRDLGVVETWQALGPFDNSSPAAIQTGEGPEKGIDLAAHYTGKQRSVGWRPLPFSAALGYIYLTQYFTPAESASAYLVSWVDSPAAQTVALRLRDSGATRVWVNGGLVFSEQESHSGTGFDQHAAVAHLDAGWNEILAKVGNTESTQWSFALRVTTPDGQPLVLDAEAATPHPRPAAVGLPVDTPVADLTAQARSQAAGGAGPAELAYAWILSHKRNFNAADLDDVHAFEAAVAAMPHDIGALIDLEEHDTDQSRRADSLEKALALDPGNAAAHRDRGWIEVGRNQFWPARADFEAALTAAPPPADIAPPGNPDGSAAGLESIPDAPALAREPQAALGIFDVYVGAGIRASALDWAQAMRAAGLTASGLSSPIAAGMHHMGDERLAAEWYQLAAADDRGNPEVAASLAQSQRDLGDFAAAEATLTQAIELTGEVPELLQMQADALAGLGREPDAIAAIEHAVQLDPDNPDLHVDAGELERRFNRTEAAVADWEQALALDPQDSELRDRLQLTRGGETVESFEKPYTIALESAIADYKRQATPALESGPLVVLADTTVTRIFPSGNAGRYVQQIFRVNNQAGADSLAVYEVTYDPATESVQYLAAHVVHADGTSADAPEAGDAPVDQSVGYETFYDVRNKYVQMPPMRAGDFVEIAYRVLPTSLESLYGDYYGDVETFGSPAATLLQQFVVITPKAKNFYYKAIRFPGEAQVTAAGDDNVYRWTAHNLPAYVAEPLAPPMVEQLPYVEVSCFQTWDQFAAWYTHLIRDEFEVDSDMVATVNSLVQGKTTTEEKVDAIYRWVIENTHYVALEFGIHGYRPYPVTQVFHRRFGDCKDKASLLIAMLHQAGIPADFVLVRIRDLGLISPDIPAVADFDHAIVYVPALHRYLDGTAEFNGADELPDGDQRAFVLRIPVLDAVPAAVDVGADPPAAAHPPASDGVVQTVTPEMPPTRDLIQRTLTGRLDAQGNLQFHMHWELTGGEAPEFRQALELPERRAGVLQAMLHDRLPGVSVIDAQVSDEDDWDQPLQFDFEGEIPHFAIVNGASLLVPRQILPQAWLPQMAALATRTQEELLSPPREIDESIDVTLPSGYHAVVPAAFTADRPFAGFSASVVVHGDHLQMQSQMVTRQSLISPALYPAFRDFWASVDATLSRPVTAPGGASAGAGAAPQTTPMPMAAATVTGAALLPAKEFAAGNGAAGWFVHLASAGRARPACGDSPAAAAPEAAWPPLSGIARDVFGPPAATRNRCLGEWQ